VTYNFEVTTENGRLKVEEKNGNKFAITDFASAGSGKVAASVPSGQNVSGSATAKLLDDTAYATTATTQAAGTVTKTDIDLTFTATDDTFSFKISDGTATAVVTPTVHDADGNGSDILAAVRTALSLSGLDDVMSASVATVGGVNVLTLEHSLGREVTISDFATTGSQTVKAESGATGVTGVAKFLDDNGGNGNSATLSTIVATSSSLASDAIEVIDRALADVNDQRGVLGSVQNRLEHTINNLTNISVNTSAAQSRIEDADYAVEAANLAKAQIMQQAGTAMLAQANAMQQTVLSLLQ
jgi:flagellin